MNKIQQYYGDPEMLELIKVNGRKIAEACVQIADPQLRYVTLAEGIQALNKVIYILYNLIYNQLIPSNYFINSD